MAPTPPPRSTGDLGRRTLAVLVAAGVLAAPALVLRALCAGESCRRQTAPEPQVPFCSLDPDLRQLLADGYRQGRSPDVLVVTAEGDVVAGATGLGGVRPPWPSIESEDPGRVPLVFHGTGVAEGGELPVGTSLPDLAPTAAEVIDVDIPHPEVRSGSPIPGIAGGESPRLLVLVAWKGVGSVDLERRPDTWLNLRNLLRDGAGTLHGRVGSLPLDPTAVLTTIGTGGLPREHGITGSTVRSDEGRPLPAWSEGAPFSVIAALGDDLDEVLRQRPRVGLVGTGPLDRGAIGRDWYLSIDRDDVVLARRPARQVEAVRDLLSSGYGDDDIPDLLAVVMHDRIRSMDGALGEIAEAARAASGGSVALVVTSTGSVRPGDGAVGAARVEAEVERLAGSPGIVEATAVGGLFLDQEVLVETGASQEDAIRALRGMEGAGGPLFDDVFGGRAVEFGRYC